MKRKGLLTFSSKQESAFIEDGFNNWKKALERFKKHETSQAHVVNSRGVCTQIQQEEPRAIPVHCLAHIALICACKMRANHFAR